MEQAKMKDSEVLINLARRIDRLLSVDSSLIDKVILDEFNFLVQSGVVNTMSEDEKNEFCIYWDSIRRHIEPKKSTSLEVNSRPRF